jgi:hypothetical protein
MRPRSKAISEALTAGISAVPHDINSNDDSGPIVLAYHQPAFEYLHHILSPAIDEALRGRPRTIRQSAILNAVTPGVLLEGPAIWAQVRKVLDVIEREMQSVLRGRSAAFWIHLYRRLGVSLDPRHENKTDARTTALVRELVELAIFKFGRLASKELALSSRLHLDRILGGVFRDAIKAIAPNRFSAACRMWGKQLRAAPQWVIQDFAPEDFTNLYFVEGLAYQYWHVCALLRTLGKGSKVTFDATGGWSYEDNKEFEELIRSIDERTNNTRFEASLIGVWFGGSISTDSMTTKPVLVSPAYNVEHVSIRGLFENYGLRLPIDFRTNFVPVLLDLRAYLDAHGAFSDAVYKKYGFGLNALGYAVWAISFILLLPRRAFFDSSDKAMRLRFGVNLLNMCQRSYQIITFTNKSILLDVKTMLRALGEVSSLASDEELSAAIAFLTLSEEAKSMISLWSGGPRHIVVPYSSDQMLVDLHPVSSILEKIFFRVQHDQGARGSLLEDEFRKAITVLGFECTNGELRAESGEVRELDAGVKIGAKLFLFECVSVERPLDYEIGNPSTLEGRRSRLDAKVEQIISLVDFVSRNPKGANYSFENVGAIEGFVSSPFHEWVWEKSARLWVGDQPRILSAGDCLDLLERERKANNNRH